MPEEPHRYRSLPAEIAHQQRRHGHFLMCMVIVLICILASSAGIAGLLTWIGG
ncbi:hypothetical protein [Methylobacterium sp. 37f]|uniref:hypothetical protein n=1 Tax=Methylobacterium sp. 37f TaxID=2817058 RepID=UPI001FFDAF9B|nr:hypothetical protein [Methylobacterium sp. 37f]MCK2056949.1 hypothetical protein [Methylobacterium sp. 37f]